VVSPDGNVLLVGYGGDGHVRTCLIDSESGGLTPTGFFADIGGQGSVGNIAVLRIDGATGPMDLALFTDKETFDGTPRGLCSYAIGVDGSLTQKSAQVDTGGIAPTDVVVWPGLATCGTADFDGDGDSATDADIEAFWACIAGSCCPTCFGADFDRDGDASTDADIEAFYRVLAGGNC
jgi:hypothetical protein